MGWSGGRRYYAAAMLLAIGCAQEQDGVHSVSPQSPVADGGSRGEDDTDARAGEQHGADAGPASGETVDASALTDEALDASAGEAPADDPTADDPTADDPTADDPTADDPTADDPTADDPTADDPTADDLTADDPTGEDPEGDDSELDEQPGEDASAPLGDIKLDAGNDTPILDSRVPFRPDPINCERDLPDYECSFSRQAYFGEMDDFLTGQCGSCHSAEGDGIAPLLTGPMVDDHDAMLPYVNLDDLSMSYVVDFVRSGHGCDDCEVAADTLYWALRDWQWRVGRYRGRKQQLDEALARWRAANVVDYQWVVQNGCFNCFFDDEYNAFAVVQGTDVVSLRLEVGWLVDAPRDLVPPSKALQWYTVDGLFDRLYSIIHGDPDNVYLRFDDTYGYPRDASIDYYYDWFDEEDFYVSSSFTVLGAGYCEASGPFDIPPDLGTGGQCSATATCSSCSPLAPVVSRPEQQECLYDFECGDDMTCVLCAADDCKSPYSPMYCAPTCPDGVCPSGYACDEWERCVELPCDQYPEACAAPALCQPGDAQADRRGCLPPTCDLSGDDCGPTASCEPTSLQAGADGCVPNPCTTDADCGCGSCVNGACATAPGFCAAAP